MIEIKSAILHILDANSGIKVISDFQLDTDDDAIKKYMLRHLKKANNEYKLKIGTFRDSSKFNKQLDEYLFEKISFVEFSKFIAETIYECIASSDKIHSCDVIVCNYIIDEVEKLAILKCNCKVGFTHQIYNSQSGVRNGIINHYAILPNAGQKIDEYAVINLVNYEVRFSDKVHYINGEDTNIMSDKLLQCDTSIAPSEMMSLVTDIIEKVAQTSDQSAPLAISKAKSFINDKILFLETDTPSINLNELGAAVFADSEEQMQSYNSYINIEKLPEKVQVSRDIITKQSKVHKIKTDTGIEIVMPADYYNNKDLFEFNTDEDGRISISLKNIGEIVNK